jgi:hypothetical protein
MDTPAVLWATRYLLSGWSARPGVPSAQGKPVGRRNYSSSHNRCVSPGIPEFRSLMMNSSIDSKRITEFLQERGLSRTHFQKETGFGNSVEIYEGHGVGIRILNDRGQWFIEVSDLRNSLTDWYDIALLRNLLGDAGSDVLSFADQMSVLKDRWYDILDAFSQQWNEDTRKQLEILREERASRRFPGWFK